MVPSKVYNLARSMALADLEDLDGAMNELSCLDTLHAELHGDLELHDELHADLPAQGAAGSALPSKGGSNSLDDLPCLESMGKFFDDHAKAQPAQAAVDPGAAKSGEKPEVVLPPISSYGEDAERAALKIQCAARGHQAREHVKKVRDKRNRRKSVFQVLCRGLC